MTGTGCAADNILPPQASTRTNKHRTAQSTHSRKDFNTSSIHQNKQSHNSEHDLTSRFTDSDAPS